MSGVRRVTLVIAVAVALVLLAAVTRVEEDEVAAAPPGPQLAATDRPMTTWYCAEGSSQPDGRADEQLYIGNVGTEPARATITVFTGPTVAPQRQQVTVAPGRTTRVRVSDIVASPDPGVMVETVGGRTSVMHRIRRGTDVALGPCAREPRVTTSFAAGSTAKGAELTIALFNPFPDDAIVDIEALTQDGRRAPSRLHGLAVPRHSRVAVPVTLAIPRVDLVAVEVTVRRGRAIAEQSLFLDGSDGRRGLAMSLGSEPQTRWWFPSATVTDGRGERLLLANPADRDATVTVRYALDAAAGIEPTRLLLPGETVTAIDLDAEASVVPRGVPFSMEVRSPRPIVAELIGANGAPQPADVRGIAMDLGFARGARLWAVAPAGMGRRSRDSLAVISTDGRAHSVRLVRVDTGEVLARERVANRGRLVLDLDELIDDRDAALVLRSTGPVAVQRIDLRVGFTRSHAIPG